MKKNILYGIVLSLTVASFVSCSKKDEEQIVSTPQKIITTHDWYYLNRDGFEKIDLPENAPRAIKKPWTESLRVCGIGQTLSVPFEGGGTSDSQNVYMLVNRLGIIECSGEQKKVYSDSLMFKDVTAEGIVFMNDNPVFSLYKNDFFNDSASDAEQNKSEFSVLVQFDTGTKIFYPILSSSALKLPPTSQVNDFFWDGTYWYYCVKNSLENKTEFSYYKWKPAAPVLSVMPPNSSKANEVNIHFQNSSDAEFRKCRQFNSFYAAPERVKKLLSCIPSDFNFQIECKTACGPSPRYYENKSGAQPAAAEGKVQIADTWIAAVFKDGTMYFSGALSKHPVLNGSRTIALRLPKLPAGFVYTDFGISETTLYVSWEEVSFFETGRAGFLSVDLEKILYTDF